MIASWMSYALLVGVLVSIAAAALERVTAARRLPARYVWFTALVLSMAWPIGSAVRSLAPKPMGPVTVLPFVITVRPMTITGAGPDRAALFDRGLIVLWCAFSALLAIRLWRGIVVLGRARREWTRRDLDGTAVQLSSNVGPAVVGLRSMDVVLPEWILSLDAPLRAIVLRHEEEHRLARDPYLLFTAAVAVALMPWNLALWLQARRLRLAIEMDCDARVLRSHPSPERYGLLMLTIAQRRSVAPSHFAPMLSEPTTQLERRILAMRTTTHRLARLTVLGGTLVAMGVLAFACSLQSDNPTSPRPSASRSASASGDPAYREFKVSNPVQVADGNPSPRYPDMLRSAHVEGEVLAQFVIDTLGRAELSTFKVLKSSHDLFTEAVRTNLAQMRFVAAVVGTRKVKQLVQMPFTFNLSRTTTPAAGGPVSRSGVRVLDGVNVVGATQQRGSAVVRPGRPPVRDEPTPSVVIPPGVYLEYQVSKAAAPQPGNSAPRYPDMLRSANVEGEVLAQFVVNEDGHPDPATFTVVKSTHELFTTAVRSALSMFKFFPAERTPGQRVKQLVQMPFQFTLSKD
ncbi:MAG: M56 family metallopeptidase [bacterium]